MLVSDVLVTKFFDEAEIAHWADVRALFGILAVLVTLGLEMVIMRKPNVSHLLLRLVFIQAVALSLPLGFLVHQVGYLSSPWSAALLASGSAFLVAQGQYFRTHGAFISSQLVQQGWRVIVFLFILCFIIFKYSTELPFDLMVAIILFTVSLLGWCLVLAGPRNVDREKGVLFEHYAISFRFLATNIILNIALFGEQLIVNGLGTNLQASIYFTHLTYFLLPITVMSAFIGFRVGPWMRDNPAKFEMVIVRHRLKIFLLTIAAVAISQGIGLASWRIVGPSAGEVNPFLMFALFISSILRVYYVIPSAYNGILGSSRDHDILIVTQSVLLIAIAVFFYAITPGFDIISVVAIAGVINWIFRTLISYRIMRNVIARRQSRSEVIE